MGGRVLRDGGRLRMRERLWGRLVTWLLPAAPPSRPAGERAVRSAVATAAERGNGAKRSGNARSER